MTDAKEKLLPVSEIYGPVVQGEGPLAGRPTVFLRMGGCDYRCVWCDSLYAVEPKYQSEWRRMPWYEIVDEVMELQPKNNKGHVTISGGNPAIHDLSDVVRRLQRSGVEVAVETQGSVGRQWIETVDHLVISPKPPSSGNVTPFLAGSWVDRMLGNHGVVHGNLGIRAIKVVVFDDEDFEYARQVHRFYKNVPIFLQVGTHVGLSDVDDLLDRLRLLEWKVLQTPDMFDARVSLQQHVLLHGHKRGI